MFFVKFPIVLAEPIICHRERQIRHWLNTPAAAPTTEPGPIDHGYLISSKKDTHLNYHLQFILELCLLQK